MTDNTKGINLNVGQDHFDMLVYGLLCARKTVSKELAKEYTMFIKIMLDMEEES